MIFLKSQWDPNSSIQGSNKSNRILSEGNKDSEIVYQETTSTAEITSFTYPGFLHIPTSMQLVFPTQIFQLSQLTPNRMNILTRSSLWGLSRDYKIPKIAPLASGRVRSSRRTVGYEGFRQKEQLT